MGNSDKTVNTKRIGVATASSLYGPWKRMDQPLLEAGEEGAWDDCNTTNPAFIIHPNGESWLYYKSWNKKITGMSRAPSVPTGNMVSPLRKSAGTL